MLIIVHFVRFVKGVRALQKISLWLVGAMKYVKNAQDTARLAEFEYCVANVAVAVREIPLVSFRIVF